MHKGRGDREGKMTTSYIKSEGAAKSFMPFALISTNTAAASRTRLVAGALLHQTSSKVFQLVRVMGGKLCLMTSFAERMRLIGRRAEVGEGRDLQPISTEQELIGWRSFQAPTFWASKCQRFDVMLSIWKMSPF